MPPTVVKDESVVGGTSEYRQRAVLAVRLRVVRASGLYDATGCRTPYGAGTTLTLCELVIAVLECVKEFEYFLFTVRSW